MTRLLVVSPQTMISMSLQHEYDVVAVAPRDLGPMVVERGYDVTVLDAADLDATLNLMSELPREHTGPFLLLAHDQASAEALDAAKGLADIRIGPPVSGASLRDTLHGIAHSVSVTPEPEVADRSEEVQPAPAEITLPAPKADAPVGPRPKQSELGRRLQGRRPEGATLERAGTPADLLALAQGLPTLPSQSTPPAGAPPAPTAPRDAPAAQRAPTTRQKLSTANLVMTLLDRVPDLLGVNVIAAAVAEDACARVSAQASAVIIAEKGGNYKRTKHMVGKFSYVRERLLYGDIVLKYVPTDLMLADMFTKAVSKPTLLRLCKMLNIVA